MKNYFDPERGATLENLRQKNDKLRVGGHLDHVVHANPASVCICIHTLHTHTCIHTQRHTHEGSGEIFDLVKCLPSRYKDLRAWSPEHVEKPGMVTCGCNPSTRLAGRSRSLELTGQLAWSNQ